MILYSLIYFFLSFSFVHNSFPEQVKCVNAECNEPISEAVAVVNYNPIEEGMISLKPNERVKVLAKPTDEKNGKCFVEKNGIKGFVPCEFIKDKKVIKDTIKIVVDGSFLHNKLELQPSQTKHRYETIDGTRIIIDESEEKSNVYNDEISSLAPNIISSTVPFPEGETDKQQIKEINNESSNKEKTIDPLDSSTTLQPIDKLLSQNKQVNQESNEKQSTETNESEIPFSVSSTTSKPPQQNSLPNQQFNKDLTATDPAIIEENKINTIINLNASTLKNELVNQMPTSTEKLSNIDEKSAPISNLLNAVQPQNNFIKNNELEKNEKQGEKSIAKESEIAPSVSSPTSKPPHLESPHQNIIPNQQFDKVISQNKLLNQESNEKQNTETKESEIPISVSSTTSKPPQQNIFPNQQLNKNLSATDPAIIEEEKISEFINLNTSITENESIKQKPESTEELSKLENNQKLIDIIKTPDLQSESIQSDVGKNLENSKNKDIQSDVKITKMDRNFTENNSKSATENDSPKSEAYLKETKGDTEQDENKIGVNIENSQSIEDNLKNQEETTTLSKIGSSEDVTTTQSIIDSNNVSPSYNQQPLNDENSENNESSNKESVDTTIRTEPDFNVINDSTKELEIGQEQEVETQMENQTFENVGDEVENGAIDEKIIEDVQEEANQRSKEDGFMEHVHSYLRNLWSSDKSENIKEASESNDFEPENNEYDSHKSSFQKSSNDEVPTVTSFSFLKYFTDYYSSIFFSGTEIKDVFLSTGEMCFDNEFCDATPPRNHTGRLLVFLGVTSLTMLLFTLGYYFIDNKRQDGRLVGMVNSLQRDLLCTTKECEILKDELLSTKEKLAGIEDSSFGSDEMVQSLKREIEVLVLKNEKLRVSLDDNEKLLRVSESATLELQNSLGDMENTMSELLAERNHTDEQIADLNERVAAFEEELALVTSERDSYKLKLVTVEKDLINKNQMLAEIQANLDDVSNISTLRECELKALKEIMKKMDDTKDLTELIDATKIKARLMQVTQERDKLKTDYEHEHYARISLANELESTRTELVKTGDQFKATSTRLEVLGNYFQEREAELLKELSTKESLWLSKQGESLTTVEKMEALQNEIQQYKEMCESARRELAENNAARRAAEAESERRAYDSWLEAQRAKREAQAHKDEAAALRRQLNAQAPSPIKLDILPPPLLPPLPRPPPLGRLPSPLANRFNDSRYSPESPLICPSPREFSPDRRPYSSDRRALSPPRRPYTPERRNYSPDRRNYSPDRRDYSPGRSDYSPERTRRSPYSSHSRHSRDRYFSGGRTAVDTETDYSPPRRFSRRSGPSSGSGASSESND